MNSNVCVCVCVKILFCVIFFPKLVILNIISYLTSFSLIDVGIFDFWQLNKHFSSFKCRQVLKTHEPVYQAIWVDNIDFDEVLISPAMIQDHMPDTVLAALNKVSNLFTSNVSYANLITECL